MAPLLLVLLLAETGPPPDPYEPLIFQMMLHEVVVRALEPVVPRIPLVAMPGAVTVPVPPTPAAAAVPAPVVLQPKVTGTAGVPGTVEVRAPVTGQVGVPGAVEVNAPAAPGLAMGPVAVRTVGGAAPVALGQKASLVARLAAGDRSEEALAQVEALSEAELVAMLAGLPFEGHEVAAEVVLDFLKMRGALAPERLASLAPACLLHYAARLGRLNSSWCPRVYELALAHPEAAPAVAVRAVAGLAGYYGRTQRYARQAETWLRMDRATPDRREHANARVCAATAFRRAGDEAAAARCFAEVSGYGFGWASGLALMHQAMWLRDEGQLDQAMDLLQTPVQGQYSEQIRLAMAALQAQLCREAGRPEEAAGHYQSVLDQAAALPSILRGENLEAALTQAEGGLQWYETAKVRPLQSFPEAVSLTLAEGQQGATAAVRITSAWRSALRVLALPDYVTAAWAPGGGDEPATTHTLHLRLLPERCAGGVQTGFVEVLAEANKARLRLPLAVRVPRLLSAHPEVVFFGALGEQEVVRRLVVRCAEAIATAEVACSGDWLTARWEQHGQELALEITARSAGRGAGELLNSNCLVTVITHGGRTASLSLPCVAIVGGGAR